MRLRPFHSSAKTKLERLAKENGGKHYVGVNRSLVEITYIGVVDGLPEYRVTYTSIIDASSVLKGISDNVCHVMAG